MAETDDFTLVNTSSHHKVYEDYERLHDAHIADPDTSFQAVLRRQYPELSLTVTDTGNGDSELHLRILEVQLLPFAAAGHAKAELDIKDETVERFRYFLAGNPRRGDPDQLLELRLFAKYKYRWGDEYFIVYIVQIGFSQLQYILKEPGHGETTMSTNTITDKLVHTVGTWANNDKYIYVYDRYWMQSKQLYEEIMKANWKDVILNEDMKKTLTELMHGFFDSKDVYEDLGVPWKRGVMFYGPALMHSLLERKGLSIPCLYVKSAGFTEDIRNILVLAREMSPCLLVFEDIDTIVTPKTRSYFLNEIDGLENNDGLFMVASTNHLDQLDPGLSSRPSRFDRKYLFPDPDLKDRVRYCEYWRRKLKDKGTIEFPKKLCLAIAEITDHFSFAYMKEAFVATLLIIARKRSGHGIHERAEGDGQHDEDDLDQYELWRVIKEQIKLLRDEMGGGEGAALHKSLGATPFQATGPDVHCKQAVDAIPQVSSSPFHSAPSAAQHLSPSGCRGGLPLRYSDCHPLGDSIRRSIQPSVRNPMFDLRFHTRQL
ncbi:MAG: hypothetical protein Q9163_000168 [Psora crenata]